MVLSPVAVIAIGIRPNENRAIEQKAAQIAQLAHCATCSTIKLGKAAQTAISALRYLRYLRRPAARRIVSRERPFCPLFLKWAFTALTNSASDLLFLSGTPFEYTSLIALSARSRNSRLRGGRSRGSPVRQSSVAANGQ